MKTKFILFLTALFIVLISVNAQKNDRLAALRTSKKIISISTLSTKADYAVQIIALKFPPEEPGFFKNIEEAREFECSDGYVRYTVGSFGSYQEAKAELNYYKELGYVQSFVVNTSKYKLNGSGKLNFNPDPNKTYTIQLSAFRFPVYLSHFKGVNEIMEFYPDDKIYRYTVGMYSYEDALEKLASIKNLGFKSAYVTELDRYLPYQIE